MTTEAESLSAAGVLPFVSSKADQLDIPPALKRTFIVRQGAYACRTRCAMAGRRSFKTDESFLETKPLEDAESLYSLNLRPSGHDINGCFASDNDGAIPSRCRESAIRNLKSSATQRRIRGHFPEEAAAVLHRIPHRPRRHRCGPLRRFQHHRQRGGETGPALAGIRERLHLPGHVHIPLRGRTAGGRPRYALEPAALGRFAGGGNPTAAETGANGKGRPVRGKAETEMTGNIVF